jgi:hypothetical protein
MGRQKAGSQSICAEKRANCGATATSVQLRYPYHERLGERQLMPEQFPLRCIVFCQQTLERLLLALPPQDFGPSSQKICTAVGLGLRFRPRWGFSTRRLASSLDRLREGDHRGATQFWHTAQCFNAGAALADVDVMLVPSVPCVRSTQEPESAPTHFPRWQGRDRLRVLLAGKGVPPREATATN